MSDNKINDELVSTLIKERRRDRRWRNIRFFIWVAVIFLIFFTISGLTSKLSHKGLGSSKAQPDKPYAALVRLEGVIVSGKDFSAQSAIPNLIRAFKDKKAKGVVLLIDSPGGSAVQSSIIHDKIVSLKHKYHKKVIVVAEDMLTSGAYLVSVAADKIYVNANTITGSVGVVTTGFGFTDAIHKLGIQRRVFTSGAFKHRLDPFEPLKPGDVTKIKRVMNLAHKSFIKDVKQGRKGKLKGNDSLLFSGDFWNGSTAVSLGLADSVNNLWDAIKDDFNVEYYVDYSTQPSFVQVILKNFQTIVSDKILPSTQAQEMFF